MIAVVFPGQGSQKPGMGSELFEHRSEARAVFEEVSSTLELDLRKLCFETDEVTLRRTDNTQVALFTCSIAAFRCIPDDIRRGFIATAGHSVGEYAALVAAGVLSLPEGARLVRRRGELMAAAPEGSMAAVLGLELEAVENACKRSTGVVVIANDNCPGQAVISGQVESVGEVAAFAKELGAKRVLPLNVGGAFHSPLMDSAAQALELDLKHALFHDESMRVYSNVTAGPVPDTSLWPMTLSEQLRSRVRWTETVQHMISEGISTFVECGVGEVLSGLVKRIDNRASTLRVNSQGTLADTINALG